MQIVNHMLAPGWYKASPNHGGPLNDPSLLVMHFTASGGPGAKGDADYFLKTEAKAAAHIVVGRDGGILQVVPFNLRAWHAGKSVWRGVSNCNDFSIGIEVVNWGKLVRTEDGQVRSWAGRSVEASSAVELVHKNETTPCLWQVYDEVQLNALTDVTRLILATYPSIKEIVGHDDIAPHRKTDPGPAFPMGRFKSLVGGRGDAPSLTRSVIATRLNARGGPGTEFEVVGVFPKGAKLEVLYDSPGPWAQVEGKLDDGTNVVAWVADQFLA